MNIQFINCQLIKINKEGIQSVFELKNKKTKEKYFIHVDESLNRIKNRVREVLLGERKNIYLSDFMTNVTITGNKDQEEWNINDESLNYYCFNKSDIIKILG